MKREFHVRFWEGGGVQFPSATRLMKWTTKPDGWPERAISVARPVQRVQRQNSGRGGP